MTVVGLLILLSLIGAGAALVAFLPDDTDDPADSSSADSSPDETGPGSTDEAGGDTDTPAASGTPKADTLTVSGSQTVRALAGNDTITASGNATVYGDTGRDSLDLSGKSTGYGGFGNDSMIGVDKTSLYGGAGDDRLYGGTSPVLDGGDGNDLVRWAALAKDPTGHTVALTGGEGDDTILAGGQDSGRIVAAGGRGDDVIAVQNTGIARGSFGADTLIGSSGTELIGGEGADTFLAMHRTLGPYEETSQPVTISDYVKGSDSIVVELDGIPQKLSLTEQEGDTLLTITWGNDHTPSPDSTVLVKGVTGMKLADFSFVNGSIFSYDERMDFVPGQPYGPGVLGTAGDDTLTAAADNSLVLAGAGNDSVTAALSDGAVSLGGGDDTLTGTGSFDLASGDGNDSISYTPGPDPAGFTGYSLDFATGAGNDVLTIDAGASAQGGVYLSVDLGAGNDSLTVDKNVTRKVSAFDGEGNDTMSMWMGHTAVMYGAGQDLLTINVSADHIDSRSPAAVLELTSTDRVVIELETGITGDVEFVQLPSEDDNPLTGVQVGGKTLVTFNAVINADDPRITITRDAVFA